MSSVPAGTVSTLTRMMVASMNASDSLTRCIVIGSGMRPCAVTLAIRLLTLLVSAASRMSATGPRAVLS